MVLFGKSWVAADMPGKGARRSLLPPLKAIVFAQILSDGKGKLVKISLRIYLCSHTVIEGLKGLACSENGELLENLSEVAEISCKVSICSLHMYVLVMIQK